MERLVAADHDVVVERADTVALPAGVDGVRAARLADRPVPVVHRLVVERGDAAVVAARLDRIRRARRCVGGGGVTGPAAGDDDGSEYGECDLNEPRRHGSQEASPPHRTDGIYPTPGSL